VTTQRSTTDTPAHRDRRLNRRQALVKAGTGVAAMATVGAAHRANAQEATPESGSPPAGTPTGNVTAERGVTASEVGVERDVTPERAALAVERVREYAPQLLAETGLPGIAIAVVYGDEVLLAEGFGVREIGTDAAVDAETVFQLASVSKSVAATVVSTVVGDGTIAWDSRMSDLAPGFALAEAWPTENVTLTDLFSHTSGLPDHAGDLLEDLGYPQADILHRLRYLTPAYSFRAGYEYTNFGLTAAAEAAASVAGQSWAELSRQRIYEPLGMNHTSSLFADYMAQPNRAVPHVKDGDAWVVTPQQRDPDAQSPAGGVSSNVNDLARWMQTVLDAGTFEAQEVIPAAALAPMHVPHAIINLPAVLASPGTQRASFYGLGTNMSYTDFGTPQWSHSGAFALGAGTAYYLLPASKFGIMALTNGVPIGIAETLCLDVLDIAQRGQVSRDWLALLVPIFTALMAPEYGDGIDWDTPPDPVTPAQPSDAYVGTYHNDYYGSATVVAAGDDLSFLIGPEPREFALTHFDRDTFSWQPTGENGPVRSGLTFTIGPDGNATAFSDQYLASGGPGTLWRQASAE
jgi:CubicO group peptidase (beta-lactamase class C family)